EMLREVREHGLEHARIQRRGGVTVEIDGRTRHADYYHPRPCARRKRRRSGALLGPDDAAWLEERGLERVPRERGALDAHRELAHPRKDRQLSERLGVDRLARRRRQHGLEAVEQL